MIRDNRGSYGLGLSFTPYSWFLAGSGPVWTTASILAATFRNGFRFFLLACLVAAKPR